VRFEGYEIGHGRTEPVASGQTPAPRPVLAGGLGWQQGQLLALYAHGLFENAAVLKALFGAEAPTLEDTFEGLADFAQNHLGVETLNSLMRPLSSTAPI
jgi:adenosylcobyric acid synthase